MGMAASQARFLQLTARMSDNEYEAQQISHQRLAVADEMGIVADAYCEATTNEIMLVNIFDTASNDNFETQLTYKTIVDGTMNGGLGMQLTSASGLIVVPDEETMNKMIYPNPDNPEELNPDGLTRADFFIFPEIKDPKTLQKNLEEGNVYISVPNDDPVTKDKQKWIQKDVSAVGSIRRTYDTTDDAAAKAIYDTQIRKLEKQDSMLEMRMNELETEHKSLETEMDSLQKVIDDNTESSFKTFG